MVDTAGPPLSLVSREDTTDHTETSQWVGGDIDAPAFLLLSGYSTDATGDAPTTIPIRTLPAILGRLHETDNPEHFVSIGTAKAISREHVRLDIAVQGGYYTTTASTTSSPSKPLPPPVQFTADSAYDHLPADRASICLTLLSKNRIVVNKERIEQGRMVVLENLFSPQSSSDEEEEDTATMKIGPLCLYILPPASSISSHSKPHQQPQQQHRWSIDVSSAKPVVSAATTNATTATTNNTNAMMCDTMTWDELWEAHESAPTDRRQQSTYSSCVVDFHAC